MKYSEKLRDPRWQKKRLEVMNRDSFTCLACNDKESTLNVHHKQYHGDPWEAPMDSLETLCEECHGARTKINKDFMALDTNEALKYAELLEEHTQRVVRKITDGDGVYNKLLMCHIISHKADYETVTLYLPETDQPDMSGAIRYCQELIPEVCIIKVYNAGKRSDGYRKSINGSWFVKNDAGGN